MRETGRFVISITPTQGGISQPQAEHSSIYLQQIIVKQANKAISKDYCLAITPLSNIPLQTKSRSDMKPSILTLITLTKLINSSSCIHDLLLAGIERMTRRAHFNLEILAKR